MERFRDPTLANILQVAGLLITISIAALGFGGPLWASGYYPIANMLFALGSFFGFIAIVCILWVCYCLWRSRSQPMLGSGLGEDEREAVESLSENAIAALKGSGDHWAYGVTKNTILPEIAAEMISASLMDFEGTDGLRLNQRGVRLRNHLLRGVEPRPKWQIVRPQGIETGERFAAATVDGGLQEIRVPTAPITEPKLEPRHGQEPPYTHVRRPYTYHRLAVYNAGPGVAENVQVFLEAIEPRPLAPVFRADFPYRVPCLSHGTNDCRINPKHEELYEVAQTWISASDKVMIGGLDTKEEGKHFNVPIQDGETWEMRYSISAGNAPPLTVIFTMQRGPDTVTLT